MAALNPRAKESFIYTTKYNEWVVRKPRENPSFFLTDIASFASDIIEFLSFRGLFDDSFS
jgi:hypothetical protein